MISRAFLLGVLLGAWGSLAQAQGITSTSGVAVYRYAEPGQPTKDIRLWGAVRSTGIYQVEQDMDLLTLLTIAGGPAIPAENDRVDSSVEIRVIRDPDAAQLMVLDTTLEALVTSEVALPSLQDGDLVSLRVNSDQRFTWREALSIATTVGTAVLLVFRISEAL